MTHYLISAMEWSAVGFVLGFQSARTLWYRKKKTTK